MDPIGWIIGGIATLVVLHRLALYAEARGWIYYRHKRGSASGAALTFSQFFDPSVDHAIERTIEEQTLAEVDESGEPLSAP